MPTPPPTNPPLVCPPLPPPARPFEVRRRDRERETCPAFIVQRRESKAIRSLLGIKAYALGRGGEVAGEVAACVDDLIGGPAGLIFRRVNEWGWEFYLANVRPERIPVTKVEKRWVWMKHFAAYARGDGGIVGHSLKKGLGVSPRGGSVPAGRRDALPNHP